MQVEHCILIDRAPEEIFHIYADVSNWYKWDPDTKASHIDGLFQRGTKGKITPTKGNTVPMSLTAVVPNRHFTVEVKIPFFCMVFEHELFPNASSTQVIHRVTLSGLLSPILGRLICAQVNKGLPITLAKLKAQAEGVAGAI
jgi:Polyketide cyclase / dehydrase and lipid transport